MSWQIPNFLSRTPANNDSIWCLAFNHTAPADGFNQAKGPPGPVHAVYCLGDKSILVCTPITFPKTVDLTYHCLVRISADGKLQTLPPPLSINISVIGDGFYAPFMPYLLESTRFFNDYPLKTIINLPSIVDLGKTYRFELVAFIC